MAVGLAAARMSTVGPSSPMSIAVAETRRLLPGTSLSSKTSVPARVSLTLHSAERRLMAINATSMAFGMLAPRAYRMLPYALSGLAACATYAWNGHQPMNTSSVMTSMLCGVPARFHLRIVHGLRLK